MPEIDTALIQRLSDEFDAQCQVRHEMGQEKYGPVKFLEVNSLQEAMNEIVDLANYARYTYIKFALMMGFDPSTLSNTPGYSDEAPVEIDTPTDIDANTSITFFNPYRRDRQ